MIYLGVLGKSGTFRPDKIRTQTFVYRAPVTGFRCAGCRIVKGVVRGSREVRAVSHQVRDCHPNPVLFVIKHDRSSALGTDTQFKRAVRVLVIERHPVQAALVVHVQIAMVEESDVGGVLSSDSLANGAMTSVVIDRIVVRAGMNVLAST